MVAFHSFSRSLISWFCRASRPMLLIFCVVLIVCCVGLVAPQRLPATASTATTVILACLMAPSARCVI